MAKGKAGAGTKDQQIAKLKARMTKAKIKEVEDWVADPSEHDAIRLASKLLGKVKKLSVRQQATYEQIKEAAGKDAAEKWRASVLAG